MDALKVLGQSIPSAGILTDAYVAPTQVTVSTIAICNQSGYNTVFRISIAVAGAADTPKQYLFYDTQIIGNRSVTVTIGATLGPTDIIRVYSGSGSVSFNIFGVEIS